jgi:3-phosphoshikimate 1-carboxyvinyltransferase
MKVSISRSEINGDVRAPSSKSYTIRGLMCAALAGGESEIVSPLSSEDTEAAVNVLSKIGVRVHREEGLWRVSGGNFHQPDADLYCGDSAATLRFMTAICSIVPGKCRLTAGPSLSRRPVKTLIEALRKLGVRCSSLGETAPVTVEGGAFRGGTTELPGDISSQYVSALLLVSPFAETGVSIRLTTPLISKPYIMMTLDCLEKFGIKVSQSVDGFDVARQVYKPTRYEVEGDWSSASYFLALGATSGEVRIENLNPESLQADKILLDLLRDMGAVVEVKGNSVTVRKSGLNAIEADLSDCIDLLPTMAVLAATAEGVSVFTGIDRARIKESDRVAAVREGLERMKIKVEEEKNSLSIVGSKAESSIIDSKGDHRIAMAFSILATEVGGTVIEGAECVAKTFPGFWDILRSIGGKIDTDGK